MDKNGRIVYYSHVCNIVYVMTSNAYKTMHVIALLKETSISLKSDFYVSLDNFFFFFHTSLPIIPLDFQYTHFHVSDHVFEEEKTQRINQRLTVHDDDDTHQQAE